MSELQQAQFNGWARVEVMGHQTHIGYVKTEAYGQAVMFRIDQPEFPARQYTLEAPAYVGGTWMPAGAKVERAATVGCRVLVGAGSIYRIIPCTETAALLAIERERRAELKLIEAPSLALAAAATPIDRDYTCCSGNPEEGHDEDCMNFEGRYDDNTEGAEGR